MTATMIVRHHVTDYATWRATFDSADMHGLHAKHGVTDSEVLRAPDDANYITIIHRFATAAAANELVNDPDLKAAMMNGGVSGPPRIEIFESV